MVTLTQLVLYFLRLGAVGFGGPVALVNSMRRDLVESRGWLTSDEYENGLALAAACPGPLAYQLAVYCGYIRFGIIGGLAVAIAFGLAPFILVTIGARDEKAVETAPIKLRPQCGDPARGRGALARVIE